MNEEKVIWLDVLTPKQAMLFGSMALELMENGYSVIITARDYDYTFAVLKNLNIRFIPIGRYADTPIDKLIEEAKRTIELIEKVKYFDILISYPNPVASRISFGLGKPYIAMTDSPHSDAPSRLSLPLAHTVVFSKCIPEESIKPYVIEGKTRLIQYNGVDELQWIKNFVPNENYIKSLGLEPYSYIVLRPPEIKASYYRDKDIINIFESILKRILEMNITIVYLPRYRDDAIVGKYSHFRSFIVPKQDVGIFGPNLLYFAIATISGGGTMPREAALLGTLGISLFPKDLYVDICIRNEGLPHKRYSIFKYSDIIDRILSEIRYIIKDPEKFKSIAKYVVNKMEKPSQTILKLLKEEICIEG